MQNYDHVGTAQSLVGKAIDSIKNKRWGTIRQHLRLAMGILRDEQSGGRSDLSGVIRRIEKGMANYHGRDSDSSMALELLEGAMEELAQLRKAV